MRNVIDASWSVFVAAALLSACSDMGSANIYGSPGGPPVPVVGQASPYLILTDVSPQQVSGSIELSYADEAVRHYRLDTQAGIVTGIPSVEGTDQCGFKACPYTEHLPITLSHAAMVDSEAHGLTLHWRVDQNRSDQTTLSPADVRLAAQRAMVRLGPGFGAPYR